MIKKTAKDLTKAAVGLRRYAGSRVSVEARVRRAGRVVVLSGFRFATDPSGRPLRGIVECLEDGKPLNLDSKYELEVLAIRLFDGDAWHETGTPKAAA